MEGRALVAEALLAGAESTEVLGGLGDDGVVQLEVDAAGLFYGLDGELVVCSNYSSMLNA